MRLNIAYTRTAYAHSPIIGWKTLVSVLLYLLNVFQQNDWLDIYDVMLDSLI